MSEVKEKLEEYIKQGQDIYKRMVLIEKINSRIYIPLAQDDKSLNKFTQEFYNWVNNVTFFLSLNFDRSYLSEFHSLISINSDNNNQNIIYNLKNEIFNKISVLNAIKENFVYIEKKNNSPEKKSINNIKSNKIFIVHGRDDGAKEATARFIEKLDLQPVILSEQPNFCYTVMEKFEKHADESDFAIVLFTPDDIGGLQSEEEQKNRARQNVIFELGYFLGKFGRDKVCLLYKGDTEIPSDIQGVTYISMDKADWKIGLCQSLKSVGFNVDANKAFG